MPDYQPITGQQILEMMSGFRPACVIGAAAELDLWDVLGDQSLTAEQLAKTWTPICGRRHAVGCRGRVRSAGQSDGSLYALPAELRRCLTDGTPQTRAADGAALDEHLAQAGRNWLGWRRRAFPAAARPSIRGFEADRAAFIAAMHTVSGPVADDLVASSARRSSAICWTWAGPRARGRWPFSAPCPAATATIFDLPDAIEQARERLAGHRVRRARRLGQRRFLRRRTAGRRRLRLGQRDLPSAFAASTIASCSPRSSGVGAGRADRHPRHGHGAVPHAAHATARCSPSTCWSTPRPAARSPSRNMPKTCKPPDSSIRSWSYSTKR